MANLTDTAVRALRAAGGQDRTEVWFSKGLGMRVSKTGRKSWIFVYHYQKKSRRITFGTYPKIGVADVRTLHATALQNLDLGIDPGNAVQVERAAIRNAPTVANLAAEYMTRHAANKKSGNEDQRMLNKDVLPHWGTLQAERVTRQDVMALIDIITTRGAPIAANRVMSLIRKMFNFGIERSMVTTNPCDHVPQPAPNVQRDRVLSLQEVRTLWIGLEQAKMTESSKLALKLQLVTAQRKGEIVNGEWSEIDFETNVWTIPAEKAKNGQTHRVFLSTLAVEILARMQTLAQGSPYFMPSPTGAGKKPIIETSIDHALRKNLPAIGLTNLTPHDLRRTAASYMTGFGVTRLTLSKILNHSDPSVTAIYDRWSYDTEKRHAMELWGTELLKILSPPQPTPATRPLSDLLTG